MQHRTFALALLLAAPTALAQNGETPPVVTKPESPTASEPAPAPAGERKAEAAFDLYGDYTFQSDFSDEPGHVSIWRVGANANMSFPVMERSAIGVGLRAERWGFEFGDATTFDAADGKPWKEVSDLAALVSFRHQFSEHWSGAVGGGLEAAFADGAEFGDSITGGGFVSAAYKFTDDLTVGFGVTARSQLEDNAFVFPLITFDWKFAEHWRMSSNPSVSRRLYSITYSPNDQWAFSFGGGYQTMDFRLDDGDSTPNGVGRIARIPIGAEVSWNPSKQLSIGVYGGAFVWQEYTLDDQNGDRVLRDQADIAPFLGAQVEWRF